MKIKNGKLVRVDTFQEDDAWWLYLVYEYENDTGKHLMIFPKVNIPIAQNDVPVVYDQSFPDPTSSTCLPRHVDIVGYNGRFRLYESTPSLRDRRAVRNATGKDTLDWPQAYQFDILMEPNVHEMTLVCSYCGFDGYFSKTIKGSRAAWNEAVKVYLESHKNKEEKENGAC